MQQDVQLSEAVLAALRAGHKVAAIKRLREESGLGLAAAKSAVEAWSGGPMPSGDSAPMSALEQRLELPREVVAELAAGRKIEAIKRLRAAEGLGLAEAKAAVEAWSGSAGPTPTGTVTRPAAVRDSEKFSRLLLGAALLVSFVWMLVNVVTVAGSLIVLQNREAYRPGVFIIEHLYYHDSQKSGMSWGFIGSLDARPARMLAPGLADAESLQSRGLQKLYPPGTRLRVLYNPAVTDTLFQDRSLHIIPWVPDILAEEKKRLLWWIEFCVLPFVAVLMLAALAEKKKKRRTPVLNSEGD